MGWRAFGSLVAAVLVASIGGVGAAETGPRVVVGPGQVRAFVDGEMGPEGVPNPPPEADLRQLTLSRGADGGYIARLTFAAPEWRRLTTYIGRRATHQVFVSLQPPGGARMRVHLNSEGVATLDRADGDRFVRVGDAVARTDGASVVFEIAPSVGMTAAWEVQGHALVRSADGRGVHAHTSQVVAGSLTGEHGRVLRLASTGVRLNADEVALQWQPRGAMPAGTRPTAVRISRRPGGLSVDVEMDAPVAVATVDGRKATLQFVLLVIGDPGNGYTMFYDVLRDRLAGFEAGADGRGGLIDRALVEVRGDVVSFLVPEAPSGEALGALDGAVLAGAAAPLAQGAGPDVPPIGPNTGIYVAAHVATSDGGFGIDTPGVDAVMLIPLDPDTGPPILPIAGGVAVLLIVGALIVASRVRAAASDDAPSILDEIDETETAGRDCSELEAAVLDARRELESGEREYSSRIREWQEVLEPNPATTLHEVGEFRNPALEQPGSPEREAFDKEKKSQRDDILTGAHEGRRRFMADMKHIADLRDKLEEAEERLRACLEGR